jgi:hypothetical protein
MVCGSLVEALVFRIVRMKGLEPPRLTAPDPKSGSATNYDTSAFLKSPAKVFIFCFLGNRCEKKHKYLENSRFLIRCFINCLK